MEEMGVVTNFLNNCNIMTLVFYAFVAITGIFYIVFTLAGKTTLQSFSKKLLKQGSITLILFNCFNWSFSAGVHWKYANPKDDPLYVLGTCAIVITFALILAVLVSMQVTEA